MMPQSPSVAHNRARKRPGRNTRNTWMWGYFFIAPTTIGMLIFSMLPVLYAFYMSLLKWDGLSTQTFIGFENFRNLIADAQVHTEIYNTFRYSLWVVPCTLVIAIVLANFLNTKIPWKSLFRVVYYLPTVTMPVAIAVVWRWLFNSKLGLVNLLLKVFGIEGPQWLGDVNYNMTALIIVSVWSGVGYCAVILLAGLQSIAKTYYEAAEIDGANALHQFRHITVPLLTPTIFFLAITSLINSLKTFDIVFMFSGANAAAAGPVMDSLRTMVFGVYQKGFTFMKMGYAASEAVLLFAIILCVTIVQFYFQNKWVFYE